MIINGGALNQTSINGTFSAPPPVLFPKKTISSIRYICTITGSADGLPDAVIPISSISGSLNADGTNSILIVCPDPVTYGVDIVSRSSGGFIISTLEYYTDGSSATIDSDEFAISGIVSARGGRNWSMSIRGKNTNSNTIFFKYDAVGLSIQTINANGKQQVRINYLSNLKPKDTLILPDDTEIIAGVITYTISSANQYMTVSEL